MAKDYYSLILKDFDLKDNEIISVYPFGSRVYGTADYKSDWDFIVVVKDGVVYKDIRRSKNNININIFSKTSFISTLKRHRMSSLECICLSKDQKLKDELNINFHWDIPVLHKYMIEKSLEDWVKAKKKFEVQDFSFIKSIFHAIRTVDFAIQIAEHGTIIDYSSCNSWWEELMSESSFDSWDDTRQRYSVRYLHLVKLFAEKYILEK
jgi:predicted nucleotidyltransferase